MYSADSKECRKKTKELNRKGEKDLHCFDENGGEYYSNFMRKCNVDYSTTLHVIKVLLLYLDLQVFM
jgi:hypothetical protein